jgi:hypothetical protein
VVDCINLILFILLLRSLRVSVIWVAMYWWNPLIIKETFNSGHVDILAFPFILAALIFSIRERYSRTAAFLALATAVKLWPLLLVPVILRPVLGHPKKLLSAVGTYVISVGLLFLPIFLAEGDRFQSFRNYGGRWQLNDAFFRALVWLSQKICILLGKHPGYGQALSRIVVSVIVIILIVWLTRKRPVSQTTTLSRCLFITAAVFFLSPTGFPWYYSWILFFLVMTPRFPLLLLTALMPIYYTRYYFDARQLAWAFDEYLVWIQYVPVWYIMLREWILKRLYQTTGVRFNLPLR